MDIENFFKKIITRQKLNFTQLVKMDIEICLKKEILITPQK